METIGKISYIKKPKGYAHVRETAALLGKSVSTITRWCETGALECLPISYGSKKTYLIKEKSAMEYIKCGKMGGDDVSKFYSPPSLLDSIGLGSPVGMVFKTFDYGVFAAHNLNRGVDPNKVKKLKKSIELEDQGGVFPIIVSTRAQGKYAVIDGQHRLAARKELGLPIYFMVSDVAAKVDISLSNSNVHKWTPLDIVKYMAGSGSSAHVDLLGDYESSGLTWAGFCAAALRDWVGANKVKGIKYGSEEKKQYATFMEHLEVFKKYPFHKEARFIRALSSLSVKEGYNRDHMAKQVKKYGCLLEKQVSNERYLVVLKNLYNYNRRGERLV